VTRDGSTGGRAPAASAFAYHDGRLRAEAVELEALAARVGTPFYCYSSAELEAAYDAYAAALAGLDATICYALKANSNQAVIRTFARRGAGADVVSGGELRRALAAGVPPGRIVFAGVGKTREELAFGLEAGIWQFNVESPEELETLGAVARERGAVAPVALRINPEVDARTHAKISTAKADSKFGLAMHQVGPALAMAADHSHLSVCGLAAHIGSQLTEMEPFESAFERLTGLYAELRAAGHRLGRLDLGGGLGIPYRGGAAPDLARYAELVRARTAGLGAHLIFEPGRRLVGNAGILATRVIFVKDNGARRFLVVDAAMNDLIRPTLYDAWHEIVPARQPAPGAEIAPVDIVGPICESGDTFARQRPMPPVAAGDLLAICSSGAYGAVMSSSYNSRPLAPEVLVRGAELAIVRPRLDIDLLIAQDVIPEWLAVDREQTSRSAAS